MGLGFFVADQMNNDGRGSKELLSKITGTADGENADLEPATGAETDADATDGDSNEAATNDNAAATGVDSDDSAAMDKESNEVAADAESTDASKGADSKDAAANGDEDSQADAENSSPLVSNLKSSGGSDATEGSETDGDSTTSIADNDDQQPKLESGTADGDDAPEMTEPNASEETPAAGDTPAAGAVAGEDVDFAVETVLTKLETGLSAVNDKASAQAFLPKLDDGVKDLKALVDNRDQWAVSDDVTVDIQLKEGKKKFADLQAAAYKNDGVKEVLADSLSSLEKLMETKEEPK